jgi:formylglycine-generating enzyme required for sulfatase activity
MAQIFISYRRKSWPFTHRLAEELGRRLNAEIFVDFTGVDETNFEHAILRNLRESDAVLLVISEHTFADRIHHDDDWVRREIREALTHRIPLVLVCVDGLLPPPGLPDDIKDVARMQGINFYPEYFTAAVDRLAAFVVKIGAAPPRAVVESPSPPAAEEKEIGGTATLDEALGLLDAGDYNKAIFLLESLAQAGYKSRYVNIEVVLAQARQDAGKAEQRRQAMLDYAEIAALARRKVTEAHAREAFAAWCKDCPPEWVEQLDTENLRERFKPEPPPKKKPSISRVPEILPPPFEWVEIPAGRVEIEGGYGMFDVPAFMIAKYPITNAQYAKFIEAGGYRQKKWWTAAGWEAREGEKWTEPRYWKDEKWNGADYPVVGVSWYEAVAFCRWLSEVSGEPVTLPTEQQWQRAAQGDEGYVYPWGDEWDGARCNNSVLPYKSNQTTPVTQYPDGASPFGVVDMAGNVLEWCLTDYDSLTNDINSDATSRVLRGGSWLNNYAVNFRCGCRDWFSPDFGCDFWGFRVSRS